MAAEVEPAALPHSHAPWAAHRARASPAARSYTVGEVNLLPLLLGTVHTLALGAADGHHKLFLRPGRQQAGACLFITIKGRLGRGELINWGKVLIPVRISHGITTTRGHTPQSSLLVCLLFLRGNVFLTRPEPVSHTSTTAVWRVCSPNATVVGVAGGGQFSAS